MYPIELEKFIETYTLTGERFDPDLSYNPTVLDRNTGIRVSLLKFANVCVGIDESKVSARRLEGRVKVFTRWDADNYLRGDPGDWLVMRSPDDLYIIGGDVFDSLYIRDYTGENLSDREDAVCAVKKIIQFSVTFASEPGILETREGKVSYDKGDALLIGTEGESWPVARERFLETYSAYANTKPGDDGIYISKGTTSSLAIQVDTPFVVDLAEGRGSLRGERGDWLIQYAPREYGIVGQEIFETTFEAVIKTR